MFVRLSAAIAAVSLLSSAALAQGAKPTDPQIAHIAYTAGVIIDLEPSELGRDFAIPCRTSLGPAIFDRNSAALDPAKLA